MATTHGFVGLAMAAAVAVVAPEYAVPAAVGGIAGGIFPDLDLVADHRRTLHFPAYYSAAAVLAVVVAAVVPSGATVAVALFLLAAAVHSISDVIGGTPEARPWESSSSKAVYFHPGDRWLRARQWIRYDGAPEDFAFGAILAVPGLLVYDDGPIVALAITGIAVSLVYTAFRKRIGAYAARWEG